MTTALADEAPAEPDEKVRTPLARAIRAGRKGKNLTQEAVASALDVRQSAVSQWEVGTTTPTLPNLLKLADVLGVSVTDLVGAETG